MNVITSFKEKRLAKQIKFERQLLKELSIKKLKNNVDQFFGKCELTANLLLNAGIEEACYDVAIEAYILGGQFSRFGYYGETIEQIKLRCENEFYHFVETLYNFFLYWGAENNSVASDQLYDICEQFVDYWWLNGYDNGERHYKLKLH